MLSFVRYLLASRRYLPIAAILVVLAFVILAILAPVFFPWDEITRMNIRQTLARPSLTLPFGGDELGRDLFGRVVWGARVSLSVAVTSVFLAMVAGLLIGALCGYYDGPLSGLVMRVMDALIGFPRTLTAIILIAILGTGLVSLLLAISLSSIPEFARLFRGPVLSLRNRDFILASRSFGSDDLWILRKHVIPNTVSIVIVQTSIALGEAILIVAGLSFLGLGPAPPMPEWGAMIAAGRSHMQSSPHVIFAPGLSLFVMVLACNIVGDALRDFFDPKSSRTGH